MTHDPRKATTLEEAARNPDGTYNGARALAWMSEAISPGQGLSEQEVRKMWERAQANVQDQQEKV